MSNLIYTLLTNEGRRFEYSSFDSDLHQSEKAKIHYITFPIASP